MKFTSNIFCRRNTLDTTTKEPPSALPVLFDVMVTATMTLVAADSVGMDPLAVDYASNSCIVTDQPDGNEDASAGEGGECAADLRDATTSDADGDAESAAGECDAITEDCGSTYDCAMAEDAGSHRIALRFEVDKLYPRQQPEDR